MGLEPTTFGITIRRSNRLSYIYRVVFCGCKDTQQAHICKKKSSVIASSAKQYFLVVRFTGFTHNSFVIASTAKQSFLSARVTTN